MKNNTKIRSLSYHLTRILGSSSNSLHPLGNGAFGRNRSSTEVVRLIHGLEQYNIQRNVIEKALTHLDIHSVEDGVRALVKGPSGMQHQFIPCEEGNPELCDICGLEANEHQYQGKWEVYESMPTLRLDRLSVGNPESKVSEIELNLKSDIKDQYFSSLQRMMSGQYERDYSSSIKFKRDEGLRRKTVHVMKTSQEETDVNRVEEFHELVPSQFSTLRKQKSAEPPYQIQQEEQENQELTLERKSESEEQAELIECWVCCSHYPSKQFISLKCEHYFCPQCTFGHIETLIMDREIKIKCMQEGCLEQFEEGDIELICKSQNQMDLFAKYTYFKLGTEVDKNPLLCWCPKPDCKGFAKRSTSEQKQQPLKCLNCAHQFCGFCKGAKHEPGKCIDQHVEQFLKLADQKNIRHCPKCKLKVEKNEGCRHMTCAVCKHEWCWRCGSNYYGYAGHDGQFCTNYVDLNNRTVLTSKFWKKNAILIPIVPFIIIIFMLMGPFHLLGLYFKKIDQRKICRCVHRTNGVFGCLFLIASFLVFFAIFPILMVVSIGLLVYTFRRNVKDFYKRREQALKYMNQMKEVKV